MSGQKQQKRADTHGPDLRKIYARLKQSGLKVTDGRRAILATLVANHGPFTAEEIYERVPLCDRATVFRSLVSLQKANLVKRCEFGDGIARFEIAEAEAHHHHLVCNACKRVEIVNDCDLLGEIDRFARKRGYSNVSHSLEFFGICPDCR